MQIHTNINTTPLFKQFAPTDALPWLLPAFSVGTSLLAFVGGTRIEAGRRASALTWVAFSALSSLRRQPWRPDSCR